jgi:5'-nucleotidase
MIGVPFFLLSNDDGALAPGMKALRQAVEPIADYLVAAPLTERSANGHAVSLYRHLHVHPLVEGNRSWGWAVDGTPADCVKLAITTLLDRPPKLVVSGINAGINVGNSVFYSGTIAAAAEGAIYGIPGVAVSMQTFGREAPMWETGVRITRLILGWVMRHPLPGRMVLNVNIPNIQYNQIKGIRCARQGTSLYVDDYVGEPAENGVFIYRNVGEKLVTSPEPGDADDLILLDGYVAVTPLQLDMTYEDWRIQMSRDIAELGMEAGLGEVSPPPVPPPSPAGDVL